MQKINNGDVGRRDENAGLPAKRCPAGKVASPAGNIFELPDASFQTDFQELLGFYGKFHRQLIKHLLGVPVDN